MKYQLILRFLFILYALNFMHCLHDPREVDDNGGLDTPDDDLEDPFDYFGDKKAMKKEKSKEKQKDHIMDEAMDFFGDQENNRKPQKLKKNNVNTNETENKVLEEKLSSCEQSLYDLQKNLINCQLSDKTCSPDNKPYFKHFMRKFTEIMLPLEEDTNYYVITMMMEKKEYSYFRNAINDENSNLNEILDIGLRGMRPLTVPRWRQVTSQFTLFNMILVIFCFGGCVMVYYFLRVLCSHLRLRSFLFIFLVSIFLVSSIWEWVRMYNKALAAKVASNTAFDGDQCNTGKMTFFSSLHLYYQRTFSTDDDKCTKYHENILVDPFYEVTPLQAVAVCASRFFAEPLKYFFSTLGESMRLFLKELPIQWQPIGFITVIILFIILVIIFSGFEISSPLLRIGIGQQARVQLQIKENELLQIKNEKERLENEVKQLKENNERQNVPKAIDMNNLERRALLADANINERRYGAVDNVGANFSENFRSQNENDIINSLNNLEIRERKSPRKSKRKAIPENNNKGAISRNNRLERNDNVRERPQLKEPCEHSDESFVDNLQNTDLQNENFGPGPGPKTVNLSEPYVYVSQEDSL